MTPVVVRVDNKTLLTANLHHDCFWFILTQPFQYKPWLSVSQTHNDLHCTKSAVVQWCSIHPKNSPSKHAISYCKSMVFIKNECCILVNKCNTSAKWPWFARILSKNLLYLYSITLGNILTNFGFNQIISWSLKCIACSSGKSKWHNPIQPQAFQTREANENQMEHIRENVGSLSGLGVFVYRMLVAQTAPTGIKPIGSNHQLMTVANYAPTVHHQRPSLVVIGYWPCLKRSIPMCQATAMENDRKCEIGIAYERARARSTCPSWGSWGL